MHVYYTIEFLSGNINAEHGEVFPLHCPSLESD